MNGNCNGANDDSSSCSETTLGETSVDLLLGLRGRGTSVSKLLKASSTSIIGHPFQNPGRDQRQEQDLNDCANVSASAITPNAPPGLEGNCNSKTVLKSAARSRKNYDSSKNLIHAASPKDKNLGKYSQLSPAPQPSITSTSTSKSISPPTQTLNELSQLSTSSRGNGNGTKGQTSTEGCASVNSAPASADELMFDMSQLSQISFPDHAAGGTQTTAAGGEKNPVAPAIAGTEPEENGGSPNGNGNDNVFLDVAAATQTAAAIAVKQRDDHPLGKIRHDEKNVAAPIPSIASKEKSAVNKQRNGAQVGKCGDLNEKRVLSGNSRTAIDTVATSNGSKKGVAKKDHSKTIDDDAPSTLHYASLPKPGQFGMNVIMTQDSSTETNMYCCVEKVKAGGQADQYGIRKGDLLYHPPTNIPFPCEKNLIPDKMIEKVRKLLKPMRAEEIAKHAKDTVRPFNIVVERLVEDKNESFVKLSISNKQISKALNRKEFPILPCCRKCSRPSLGARYHHCLCKKHKRFRDSGAREKLIILLAGAQYGCQKCIGEIETGKKNTKVLHNIKCHLASNLARYANSETLSSNAESKTDKASNQGRSSSKRKETSAVDGTIGTDALFDQNPNKPQKVNRKRKAAPQTGMNTMLGKEKKNQRVTVDEVITPTADTMFVSACTPRKVGNDTTVQTVDGQKKGSQAKIVGNRSNLKSVADSDHIKIAEESHTTLPCIPVTPAPMSSVHQDSTYQIKNMPLLLSDDISESKWVPSTNPWGDRAYKDGDFVLFSPEDYDFALKVYGPDPKRFVPDPFDAESTDYHKTHYSQEERGFHVLQLSRDPLALRSWGFDFCCHDFGGACLVTKVEPMSPADAAVLICSGAKHAPLRPNDMIVCVNNKNLGNMTDLELGVELDMSGSQLSLIVSRYRMAQKGPEHSWIRDNSYNLHWNEMGADKADDKRQIAHGGHDPKESCALTNGNYICGSKSPKHDPINKKDTSNLLMEENRIVTEILRLKIENLPHHIEPIESREFSSGYMGVCMILSRWRATISLPVRGNELVIGDFDLKVDAARMYSWAFSILNGLNFSEDERNIDLANDGLKVDEEKNVDIQEENSDQDYGEKEGGSGRQRESRKIETITCDDEKDLNLINVGQDNEDDVCEKNGFHKSENVSHVLARTPSLTRREATSSNEEASDSEGPEWDHDSNPWLGCVCGEIHERPIPVFWLQCDSCDAWFNCRSSCLGFDSKEAKRRKCWKCPDCEPFDASKVPKKIHHTDLITPDRTLRAHQYKNEDSNTQHPIPVGTVVDVVDRTWRGSNKPGGVAKIIEYHTNDGVQYDVQYVVNGGREMKVDSKYVSVNHALMDSVSPRLLRSGGRLTQPGT